MDEALRQACGAAAGRGPLGGESALEGRTEACIRRIGYIKKGHCVLRQRVCLRYAFIHDQADQYPVRRLCHVMAVQPSGYFDWRRNALSERARDDQCLLGLIKYAWLESGSVYGYHKIQQNLREAGETCGKHRVGCLMRYQPGYPRRPGTYGGKPAVVSPNRLDHLFDVTAPNVAWVTDITYIRTHKGWLYLSVVIDLFSRQVVGWSMKPRMTTDLAWVPCWQPSGTASPKGGMVHSDLGSQLSSADWQSFFKANHLKSRMSCRGNCHDNAVAESFFQLLKQERIKHRIYLTREAARSDVFDYIEMLYNPRRR